MDEHAKRWHTNIFLFESGDETAAEVTLDTGTATVQGLGRAKRNPADARVEGIGEEVAAGRAMIALGRRLLGMSEDDIEAIEGHKVHVSE